MNKRLLILTIIFLIIILGFLVAFLLGAFIKLEARMNTQISSRDSLFSDMFLQEIPLCTMMYCFPSNPNGRQEIMCNGCTLIRYIFTTGILNVQRECSAKEIMIYDNAQLVGIRYEKSSCRYKVWSYLVEVPKAIFQ